MAEWIIEAGPEIGSRRIVKDGVDITAELSSLTLVIDRTEVLVTVEYVAGEVTLLAEATDSEPESEYCFECERPIEVASDHDANCPNSEPR